MSLVDNIDFFKNQLKGHSCKLVAISKTKPESMILEAYRGGHKVFGENKVQDLVRKYEALPKDIEWHFVGHLQSNKVKYIAPFVDLIHAIDSMKLLMEINKQGVKNNRVINCLMQIHIAKEETKYGLSEIELFEILKNPNLDELDHVRICGLMGMATYTSDMTIVREEFKTLKNIFDRVKGTIKKRNIEMEELSMGMTDDYKVAIEEGSTMIRIGTAIFGERNY